MYLARFKIRDFVEDASVMWRELKDRFQLAYGYSAQDGEIKSWKKSLPALADVFKIILGEIGDCPIYVEYNIPGSNLRADVIIAGCDSKGYRSAIVIELKQWKADSIFVEGSNLKVGGYPHLHPSDQALGYRDYLESLAEAFADLPCTLKSCSYLHNTLSNSLLDLQMGPFSKLTQVSPLFSGDQKHTMAKWISDTIITAPDSRYVAELDLNKLSISKHLFDTVASAVREEPAWVLLDEQKIAFNQICDLVKQKGREKHLVLVTGGPGTGKSVIAMQLMGELCRMGVPCVHVTNSSSFTTVMKSLIQQKRSKMWGSRAVEALFKLSHAWVRRKDQYDVAICDEAHRFRSSTTLRWLRSRRPQGEEIMECVQTFVAFIDERQRLRRAEEGTVSYFKKCARNVGIEPQNIHGPIKLGVQFRYAGNESFVVALEKALYENTAEGFPHNNFDIKLHNSIEDMETYLQERLRFGRSARLLAGFCWEWSDPNENNELSSDIHIGSWSRPWNRKSTGRERPDQHPYTLWATRAKDQLSEVGCIYSSQGFEFDYVGVIWGLDLVWRNGSWSARPKRSFDKEMWRGRNPISSKKALPLLKNAYRVLCSRGMLGCSIFCLDKETSKYLKCALVDTGRNSSS